MKLQLHCDNCGAIVFPGSVCRYCKAPVGHVIGMTDKRSALPTERVIPPDPTAISPASIWWQAILPWFTPIWVVAVLIGIIRGGNGKLVLILSAIQAVLVLWAVHSSYVETKWRESRDPEAYIEVLAENKYRLDAEARVLLDPANQDDYRQEQIMESLVWKYFPPGYYFMPPNTMNTSWAYNLGWERADDKSPWQPVIKMRPAAGVTA